LWKAWAGGKNVGKEGRKGGQNLLRGEVQATKSGEGRSRKINSYNLDGKKGGHLKKVGNDKKIEKDILTSGVGSVRSEKANTLGKRGNRERS